MTSLTQNDPLAQPFVRIIDGLKDGDLIGVSDKSSNSVKAKQDLKPFLEGLGLKPREVAVIKQDVERALRTGKPPTEEVANAVFQEVTSAPSKPARQMEIHDGNFIPVFGADMNMNRIAYIFAPSGAGKSTATKKLALEWQKNNTKKAPVYIFSRFNGDSDDSLKIKNAEYVSEEDMDSHLIAKSGSIKCKDLTTPCLCIFDDYDSFGKKSYESCAETLRDILECGRKLGVSCIITSHLAVDRTKPIMRTIWNEAHIIIMFPQASTGRNSVYPLESYCGLDKEQIAKIMKLPSRWVAIKNNYPMCVASEHEVYIL